MKSSKLRLSLVTISLTGAVALLQLYQNCSPTAPLTSGEVGPTSKQQYRVSVNPAPERGVVEGADGSLLCGDGETQCSIKVDNKSRVTLTAKPASGMKFDSWTGSCSFIKTPTCALTITRNTEVSANFSAGNYAFPDVRIKVTVTGQGRVQSTPAGLNCTNTTTNCIGTFKAGTAVTLSASPSTGYESQNWSANTRCSPGGTCQFTPDGTAAQMDVSHAFIARSTQPSPTPSPTGGPSPSPAVSQAPTPSPSPGSQVPQPTLNAAGEGHFASVIWMEVTNLLKDVTSVDFRSMGSDEVIGSVRPPHSALDYKTTTGMTVDMKKVDDTLKRAFFWDGGVRVVAVNGPGKYTWPPQPARPVTIAVSGTQEPYFPLRGTDVVQPWTGQGDPNSYPCAIWILGGNLAKTEVWVYQGGPARSDGNGYADPQTETKLGVIESSDLLFHDSPLSDKPLIERISFNVPAGNMASEYKTYGLWIRLRDTEFGAFSNWLKFEPGPQQCDPAPPAPSEPPDNCSFASQPGGC